MRDLDTTVHHKQLTNDKSVLYEQQFLSVQYRQKEFCEVYGRNRNVPKYPRKKYSGKMYAMKCRFVRPTLKSMPRCLSNAIWSEIVYVGLFMIII